MLVSINRSFSHLHALLALACCSALVAPTGCSDDDGTPEPDAGHDATVPQDAEPDGQEPDGSLELVMPSFDASQLQNDMNYLASAQCAGRATATTGNELALAYVESQFALIGLEPAGDTPGSYRQEFPYKKFEQLDPPVVTLEGATLVSGEDYTVVMYGGSGQVDATVMFAGYGFVVPPFDPAAYPNCPVSSSGFDEYEGQDVTGKIVLMNIGVPNDDYYIYYCPIENSGDRFEIARARGAAGMMWVMSYSYPLELLRGYLLPPAAAALGIPAVAMHRGLMDSAVPQLQQWVNTIDQTHTPQSRDLGISASINVNAQVVDTVSYNLLGAIPGGDPLIAHETVLISGHIDAHGVDEETGALYAGANDNASGTVAAYRIAEQIIAQIGSPRRTILVAAWNGEETGLWGSCYYANHPLHSLFYTVAMVNIEMLSSGSGASLLAYGQNDTTTGWMINVLEYGIEDLGIPVEVIPLSMGSDSDHWCFYQEGVAATSIRGGPLQVAPGYHTPEDNLANFVFPDMVQGMEAIWALVLPLALGVERRYMPLPPRPAEIGSGRHRAAPFPFALSPLPPVDMLSVPNVGP